MKRNRLLLVLVVAIALGLWGWLYLRPLPVLTVTTWPGTYGRAQAIAMFHPYMGENRVHLRIAQYDGGLDHLSEEVRTGRYDWDVIDLELTDAVRACQRHLLAPIDAASLPAGANGIAATQDFMSGAIGPCWVASVVFTQVIAYVPSHFGARGPRTAADFFDTARFPGPRSLNRTSARLNLELALLADGVRARDVYPLLSTSQGVDRALAKLALLGPILWWTNPEEPLRLLEEGRVTMATALNGSLFDAELRHRPLAAIWDRNLYEYDVFAIPFGDPRQERARAFIAFATSTDSLSRVSEWVPYGPARRSSQARVGRNPDLGVAMQPWLPTTPQNAKPAFAVDDAWWQSHGAAIAPIWQEWVSRNERRGLSRD